MKLFLRFYYSHFSSMQHTLHGFHQEASWMFDTARRSQIPETFPVVAGLTKWIQTAPSAPGKIHFNLL